MSSQARLVGSADPAAVSVDEAFRRIRAAIRNWYTSGILAVMVAANRIPPRKGLKGTWLGRHVATFRLFDGATIRCPFEDAGDVLDVYVNREYERAQISWPDLKVIFDVGATVGCFTVWAAHKAPNARFIAVEPNPAVIPFLRENIRRNGLDRRVEIVEAAVGGASGTAAIEDDSQFSNLVRVVPTDVGRGATVRLMTLENIFSETKTTTLDLLKIDCEGAEYEILLGAPDEVLEGVRVIVCEYHFPLGHQPEELVDRLRKAGFDVASDHGPPFGLILGIRPT